MSQLLAALANIFEKLKESLISKEYLLTTYLGNVKRGVYEKSINISPAF